MALLALRSCSCCLALLVLACSCAPSAVAFSSGVARVSFTSDETCGFSDPYTVDARGCRRIDEKAVMCKGFGVIDGVLFAGGCEAPAELEILETQGTLPVSTARSRAAADEIKASPAAREDTQRSDAPTVSAEPRPPEVPKKTRSSSKKGAAKKARTKKVPAKRKKRRAVEE